MMQTDTLRLHPMEQILVEPDAERLADRAARWLIDRIAAATGRFRLALAGGSTPRRLYSLLASDAMRTHVDWQRLELFWGDERVVPHDHPDSNCRMVRETLLSHGQVPPGQVHPIPTDGDPDDAARRYEALLKQGYGAVELAPARPLFDVVLLGLGEDGHIASLLPGSAALDERVRWAAPVTAGRPEARITLTYPAIESSRAVVFLVSGPGKAAMVAQAIRRSADIPATRLRASHEVIWFLDGPAASALGEAA